MSSAGMDFQPGRLRSLWDMLEIDAYRFVGITNVLRSITGLARQFPERVNQAGLADPGMAKHLRDDAEVLAEMRLPTSRSAFLKLADAVENYGPYNDFANTKVGSVCEVMRLEMEGRKFLQIERDDLYSDGPSLFGPDVAAKFASAAAFEIDEAGKCIALGRSTACVFHLMRLMEVGVKAASACLGIPDPVKDAERNWGVMLRKINDEIGRRNKAAPAGWPKADDKDFFAEIYVSLDAVRNVWRNATMHVENKYTQEEAEHILGAVRGFMREVG